MRIILQQMQEDPKAAQDHLRNPEVARRLQKLINAGIISVR
jgi:stress-induced-phosphoprotein 1